MAYNDGGRSKYASFYSSSGVGGYGGYAESQDEYYGGRDLRADGAAYSASHDDGARGGYTTRYDYGGGYYTGSAPTPRDDYIPNEYYEESVQGYAQNSPQPPTHPYQPSRYQEYSDDPYLDHYNVNRDTLYTQGPDQPYSDVSHQQSNTTISHYLSSYYNQHPQPPHNYSGPNDTTDDARTLPGYETNGYDMQMMKGGEKKRMERPNFEDTVTEKKEVEEDGRKKLRGCLPRSGVARFPQVNVLEIRTSDLNLSAFEFSLPKEAGGNFNRVSIKMNLKMNISCFNENLYDLNVDSISLNANIEVNATALRSAQDPRQLKLEQFIGPPPVGRDPNYKPSLSRPIGTGSRKAIVFPSKQNKTFEMEFAIQYTPDPQLGLVEDPTFAELMNVCGVTGRERSARISYTAQTTVSFLKSFGYKPEISNSILIKCPLDKGTLNDIFSTAQTQPNLTAAEIVEKVFGALTIV
ncbi:hypothetical protein HDU67_002018 [Dinochytrium kinnereticum]|nr:hypothetical protein HDU67_002018 [Dinochytrium kinnereticum]